MKYLRIDYLCYIFTERKCLKMQFRTFLKFFFDPPYGTWLKSLFNRVFHFNDTVPEVLKIKKTRKMTIDLSYDVLKKCKNTIFDPKLPILTP